MQIMDAIYRRRAVRAYRDEAVDTELIEALIEAAIQAPSAMNAQPWRFTVVRDRRLLDRASRGAKAHLLENLPPDGGQHNWDEMLADRDYHIFYNAPALIVISAVREGSWAIEDCAMAAENLMLAACAHGLGSCWIGFAQSWLQLPEGKAALDIDADWLPVAPIIVGHPDGATKPVERNRPEIRWIDEGKMRAGSSGSLWPDTLPPPPRPSLAAKHGRTGWACVHGTRRYAATGIHGRR